MGGSTPAPPPVQDPAGVAGGQFASNLAAGESAQAGSQVNQITPTGALTYYQTGVGPNGVPTYTAISQLTPQQQQLLNLQQQGMGIAGGAGANMLANAFGQYSQAPDLSSNAGGLTQKLLQQQTSYLDPYFTNQTDHMDNQLRNQGIMPGTPAYNEQMNQIRDTQNRAVTQFLTTAEPQAFSQAQQEYMTPLQVGTALSSFNQPGQVGAPYTGQAPGYQPANLTGAVASAQQTQASEYAAQVQAQQAQQNAMMGGLMGIGKAAVPFLMSDRRLKQNIKKLGKVGKLPYYLFQYLWSPKWHVGFMADEVEKIAPEAVVMVDGYKAVNYTAVWPKLFGMGVSYGT